MAVNRSHTSLLDLPQAVLVHILGFVALEGPEPLSEARLACRTLQLAGEAVPRRGPLVLTAAKLQEAREAGCDSHLLAFWTRIAQLWRRAVVEVQSVGDLQLLGRLAGTAGSLSWLELRFVSEQSREDLPQHEEPRPGPGHCFRLPKELAQLTCLTALSIRQDVIKRVRVWLPIVYRGPTEWLPASDLAQLSTLTALQSLTFSGTASGTLPTAAISNLQQLTSLDLTIPVVPPQGAVLNGWVAMKQHLGSQHLMPLTALRRLRLVGVEPHLSAQQALEAWQHLENLRLLRSPKIKYKDSLPDAGFWPAVPRLPCLTLLEAESVAGEPSKVLSSRLPARLASLKLRRVWVDHHYSESSLPSLPPTLTAVELGVSNALHALPLSANLRRLVLMSDVALPEWPDSASAMVQLTGLSLRCPLEQYPAPLVSLPAVEVLELHDTGITDLPHDLACVGSLRQLALPGHRNSLSGVPAVLGGGAASRLEHLDLTFNYNLVVDDDGLAVLKSLTALTYLIMAHGPGHYLEPADVGSEVLRRALEAPRKRGPGPPYWPLL